MKLWQRGATLLAFAAGMAGIIPANAADSAIAVSRTLEKDAVCTKCHDESEQKPVLAMYKTRHGVKADSRTPGCQTCHGASDAHVKNPAGTSIRPVVDVSFGANSKTSPQAKSDTCVSCHQSGKRIHWAGSAHQSRDVACTSCHEVHAHSDKVLTKTTQSEVCFTCHKEQRALIDRPSRHPIKEGKVACSDCHNPHGSAGPSLMVRDSVVDTCYTCHMEKRGPFVRTHQPVQEDCSICHNPHGTTTPNLLKARTPFLCQQCHEPTSHRGAVASLVGPPSATSVTANTLARGCLNCHTQIHGTNNPANISNDRTFRR